MVIVTANGTQVRALGLVENLLINISHMLIKTPVHVLESKDSVLILGNDWLKRVNAIVNYEKENLLIRHKGRSVKIPLTFTTEKEFIVTEIPDDEEDEYDTEDDLLEAQIYYSDNAYSSE